MGKVQLKNLLETEYYKLLPSLEFGQLLSLPRFGIKGKLLGSQAKHRLINHLNVPMYYIVTVGVIHDKKFEYRGNDNLVRLVSYRIESPNIWPLPIDNTNLKTFFYSEDNRLIGLTDYSVMSLLIDELFQEGNEDALL